MCTTIWEMVYIAFPLIFIGVINMDILKSTDLFNRELRLCDLVCISYDYVGWSSIPVNIIIKETDKTIHLIQVGHIDWSGVAYLYNGPSGFNLSYTTREVIKLPEEFHHHFDKDFIRTLFKNILSSSRCSKPLSKTINKILETY